MLINSFATYLTHEKRYSKLTVNAYVLDLKQFDDYIGHKFSYGPVLAEKELLFPIPTSEVRNNKNLDQNKGY